MTVKLRLCYCWFELMKDTIPKKIPVLFSRPKKIPASFIDPKKFLLAKMSDPKNPSDPPSLNMWVGPLGWRPSRIRQYREYPTWGFSWNLTSSFLYKWYSIIEDVLSEQQIPGRTKTSETGGEGGGSEFYFSLTERKHGSVIFLTLRLTAASTKPMFDSF